jgi:hypothetical protein
MRAHPHFGSGAPRDGAARRLSRAHALAAFVFVAGACGGSDGARDTSTHGDDTNKSDHSTGGASASHGSGGSGAQSHGSGGQGGGGGGSTAMQHDAGSNPQTMMLEDAATSSGGNDAGASAASTTAFRVGELFVRDPHMFLSTTDITDDAILGTSVNGSLVKNGLTMDYDMNGFLDVSILPILTPSDPSVKTASLHLADADCSSDTQCQAKATAGLDVDFTIENRTQGNCLEPMDGTTSDFTPAIDLPVAPCFVTTEGRDFSINLGGVTLQLTAARIAASYDGDKLAHGLLMGFLTDMHAMQALLPDYLPLLGGTPLTDYLRDQDRDMAQSPNAENGFWLYINFTAIPVDYSAP